MVDIITYRSRFKYITSIKNYLKFKTTLVAIAHNYINIVPDKIQFNNIKEMVNRSNTTKKNNKIVISEPDKDSGIVLLNKKEYLCKMNEVLNDIKKYVKLGQTSEF